MCAAYGNLFFGKEEDVANAARAPAGRLHNDTGNADQNHFVRLVAFRDSIVEIGGKRGGSGALQTRRAASAGRS